MDVVALVLIPQRVHLMPGGGLSWNTADGVVVNLSHCAPCCCLSQGADGFGQGIVNVIALQGLLLALVCLAYCSSSTIGRSDVFGHVACKLELEAEGDLAGGWLTLSF